MPYACVYVNKKNDKMRMTEGSIYFNIDHIDSHFNLTLKREREGERA